MKCLPAILIFAWCLSGATAHAQITGTSATTLDLATVLSGSVGGNTHYLAIETTGTSNKITLAELWKASLAASTLTGSTGINVNRSTGVILNTGVTSLTGPTDHFLLSAVSGNITISLPQSISTTASPTFAGLAINGNMTATGAGLLNSLSVTNAVSAAGLLSGTINNSGSALFGSATVTGAFVSLGTLDVNGQTTLSGLTMMGHLSSSGVDGLGDPITTTLGRAYTLTSVLMAGGKMYLGGNTSSPYIYAFASTVTLSGSLTLTGGSGGILTATTARAYNITATNGLTSGTLAVTGASSFTGGLSLPTLTDARVLILSGNAIAASAVTQTTLGFLDATSSIQTQLNAKQDALSGSSLITLGTLTVNSIFTTSDVVGTLTGTSVAANNLRATTFTLGSTGIGSIVTSLTQAAGATIFSNTTGVPTFTSTPSMAGLISGTINNSGNGLFGSLTSSAGISGVTLTISGSSQFGGAAQFNNNITGTGTLTINGATTLSGAVTMSNTLNVISTLTAGSLVVQGITSRTHTPSNGSSIIVNGTSPLVWYVGDASFASLLAGTSKNLSLCADNSFGNGLNITKTGVGVGAGAVVPNAGFDNTLSFNPGNVTELSANTTITAGQSLYCMTLTGAITATLPTPVARREYVFVNTGSVTATVSAPSGLTIMGNTTLSVPAGGNLTVITGTVSGTNLWLKKSQGN